MDRRLKTTAVAVGAVLFCWAASTPGWAQYTDGSSNSENAASYDYNSDQYQSPAQRNPELPKGLTIVPWKLERRPDRINLLSGNDATSTRPAQKRQ